MQRGRGTQKLTSTEDLTNTLRSGRLAHTRNETTKFDAPDHGNVPVLELPLELVLRVNGNLVLGIIVQVLLRDDLVNEMRV